MKINIIITGLFRSGGMRVIFEYANRLQSRGHDVVCFVSLKPYYFMRVGMYENLRKYVSAFKNYLKRENLLMGLYSHCFDVKWVPCINNCFIRNADVTIATQWPTAYSLSGLDNDKGKKVYFIQDYEAWNSDIQLVNNSYRLNLRRITCSEYLRNLLFNDFGVDSYVVLDGVDFEFFNVHSKKYSNDKTLTFIDHYLDKKGVTLAIEVVNELHMRYNNLKFLCFGYQKYHSIPNFVTFIENPSDEKIRCIFQNTDIFLFTSLVEGFGLPPAEAMACKCAVVTSKVGAIPEYSVHGKTAIHVNPNNSNEFFEGVCYLLDNESELERISTEGYNMVRSILSWDKSVEKFEKYLLNI